MSYLTRWCWRAFLLALLATSVVAQAGSLVIQEYPTVIRTGDPQTITYTAPDLSKPVTFTLRRGESSNLRIVSVLGTATGGSFTWTPSDSLEPDDDYALEIAQGTITNYSAHVTIVRGGSVNTDRRTTTQTVPSSSPVNTPSSAPETEASATPRSSDDPAPTNPTNPPDSTASSDPPATTRSEDTASPTQSPPGSTLEPSASDASPDPSAPPRGDSGGGGLSTGAKVGIGIGVPIGVLLVGVAAFVIGRRSRSPAPGDGRVEVAEVDGAEWRGAELPARETGVAGQRVELGGREMSVAGKRGVSELPG